MATIPPPLAPVYIIQIWARENSSGFINDGPLCLRNLFLPNPFWNADGFLGIY